MWACRYTLCVHINVCVESGFLNCFVPYLLALNLELKNSPRLAGQQDPGIGLSLPPLALGGTDPHHEAELFTWVLGIELKSSYMHSRHYTNQVVSLAPKYVFFVYPTENLLNIISKTICISDSENSFLVPLSPSSFLLEHLNTTTFQVSIFTDKVFIFLFFCAIIK